MQEAIIPEEVIISKIYYLRKHRVMLDKDLAELYKVKPIRLREQVKRNAQRFPENFMFQLTEEETEFMLSQNAIPSRKQLGGALPYMFTEHGVLMPANVLKSDRAMLMSVKIIEVFVKLREIMITNGDILLKLEQLEQKVLNHDESIQIIFDALRQMLNPPILPHKPVGYKRRNEKE